MKVREILELLHRLQPDDEIAIDWATKQLLERGLGRNLSQDQWLNAIAEWEMTVDPAQMTVEEQVALIIDHQDVMAEQNRNYYKDLGVENVTRR